MGWNFYHSYSKHLDTVPGRLMSSCEGKQGLKSTIAVLATECLLSDLVISPVVVKKTSRALP